jgi:hypothetical protein
MMRSIRRYVDGIRSPELFRSIAESNGASPESTK